MAIAALVLGIVGVLALFDDSEWDTGTVVGLGMFAVAGLALGIVSMNKERTGNGVATAGIVLAAVLLLV